jgi:hypothetical protein
MLATLAHLTTQPTERDVYGAPFSRIRGPRR